MKNLFYPLLIATAFVATACTNNQEDDVTPVDPTGKTPISFVGQSNNNPITRAGFTKETQIVMHIRSNKNGGDTDVRETRTVANAAIDETKSTTSTSAVSQLDSYIRYWDDAFGRDAQLSVFAIAVPGKTYSDNTLESKLTNVDEGKVWNNASLSEDVTWSVSTDQSKDNIVDNEDLVYSNNIQGDNKLKFNTTSGTFAKGNLQFTHALSRVSVNLKKGTGFTESGSFKFTSATGNVNLINVPVSGKLDLTDGTWNEIGRGTISGMMLKSTSATAHSLIAQVLPGYEISRTGTDANMLSFEIDNNTYYVTQDKMYEALTKASDEDKAKITIGANSIVMQQGINYIFNITVNKTSVVVTAKLAAFEEVTADIDKNNSHGELTFNTTGDDNDAFKLYRLEDSGHASATNWFGAYTAADPDQLTKENGVWKTGWYFENDAAYYHFRAVSNNVTIENSSTDGDYFNISSGTTDYHWGAPMKADATFGYDKSEGYKSSISTAIRATTSTINLIELHMMSNIHIVLRTTTGKDAVVLEDKANDKKCEVNLTNFYAKGKVNLGNGLVTVTSTDLTAHKDFSLPTDYNTEKEETGTHVKLKTPFTLFVVPQYVKRSGDAIGLTITTPDGNVYTSKDLSASTSTTFWEPNHQYTYTFTLTKTGASVTCTVQDWVYVTANQNISLED